LTIPLLILNERNPNEPIAAFTKPNTRGDYNAGMLNEQISELRAAHPERRVGTGTRANMMHWAAGYPNPNAQHFPPHITSLPVNGTRRCRQIERIALMQSSEPLRAAVAATWIGAKAP
jgi:hypothetical protein